MDQHVTKIKVDCVILIYHALNNEIEIASTFRLVETRMANCGHVPNWCNYSVNIISVDGCDFNSDHC